MKSLRKDKNKDIKACNNFFYRIYKKTPIKIYLGVYNTFEQDEGV